MADMTNHMNLSSWADDPSNGLQDVSTDDDAVEYLNAYHPNMHDDFIHCAISHHLSFAISGRMDVTALLLGQDWYQVPDE